MLADIQRAKSEGYLKNLYISVGGGNNSFQPNGANPANLAAAVLKLM